MLHSFSSSALYVFILQKKENSWMEEGEHLKVKWELEVARLTPIPFEELQIPLYILSGKGFIHSNNLALK